MSSQLYGMYKKTMAEQLVDKTPEQLMILLYDGMLTKLKQAKERFTAKQTIPAKECVIRAMKITHALMDNLNMDEGGNTAKNLEQLYYYIIFELSQANNADDDPITHIDNAIRVVQTLGDAWKQLEKKSIS